MSTGQIKEDEEFPQPNFDSVAFRCELPPPLSPLSISSLAHKQKQVPMTAWAHRTADGHQLGGYPSAGVRF